MIELERRMFNVSELRVDGTDKSQHIIGHAATFDDSYDMGYFRERLERGAFKSAIQTDDVRALFNHDPNLILGRTKSKTVRLKEDAMGLYVEIDPPDTVFARDLVTSIQRGDVSQMSFSFSIRKEEWDYKAELPMRIIKDVQLFDVSPVTYPANSNTDVSVALRHLAVDRQSVDDARKKVTAPCPKREAARAKLRSLPASPDKTAAT